MENKIKYNKDKVYLLNEVYEPLQQALIKKLVPEELLIKTFNAYAQLFNKSFKLPCKCSKQRWKDIFRLLDQVYKDSTIEAFKDKFGTNIPKEGEDALESSFDPLKLNYRALQQHLKSKGINAKGTKEELIERLKDIENDTH